MLKQSWQRINKICEGFQIIVIVELQRIIQAIVTFLIYEWITRQRFIENEALVSTIKMTEQMGKRYANSELAFGLLKARGQHLPLKEVYECYEIAGIPKAQKAAGAWKKKYPLQ